MRASSAEQFGAMYGRVLNSTITISSNAGQDAFAHDIR
jgi:hypothetical protein